MGTNKRTTAPHLNERLTSDADFSAAQTMWTTPVQMTDSRTLTDFTQLKEQLDLLGNESVFVVADPGAYKASGAAEKLQSCLCRRDVTFFSNFEPNPKLPEVLAGLDLFQKSAATAVLAVGGGSAIDIAKLIAGFSNEPGTPPSLIHKTSQFVMKSVPLFAIPTTSGTGSEATQFAVVYVEGMKYSVDHPKLLPTWCLLDPELSSTLPPHVTAHTGLDAFCQAIESIWSVRANDESTRDATEAARLALLHLHTAVHAPTPESRMGMCLAAHLAGRAIHRTRTTAPHAISYTLTSDYRIPHGHAVALSLGAILIHNSGVTPQDCNDSRGVAQVQRSLKHILSILQCETPEEGNKVIQNFVASLGCETSLNQLGVHGQSALRAIASKVNVERLQNNPRKLTSSQLFTILQSFEK